MGRKALSEGILTDIFTLCVAISDAEGATALLFTNDLSSGPEYVVDPIRQADRYVRIPETLHTSN